MTKTHRGRHSPEHNIRRYVQYLIMDNAFFDRERAEKVNVLAISRTMKATYRKLLNHRY